MDKSGGGSKIIRLKWFDRFKRGFVFLNFLFSLEEKMTGLGFRFQVALVERVGFEFNFAGGDHV